MATASFKSMMKDGIIKRADAMKVPYSALHVEPGFNLRDHDDEFEQGISELTAYILDGGYVPPLEVRARPEGDGVIIVDGHRRHIAIGRAIEQGAPIELVAVVAFAGNDADRVARIMTSNEGVKLRPLEVAAGYKRLSAFGLAPDEIARKVGKTRQHVEQLLILANANSDVHALVKVGVVSAALAIEAVRKHGEGAGAFLEAKHGEAKAAGKSKVTAATMKPKALPRAVVDSAMAAVDEFMDSLPTQARERLTAIEQSSLPDGQEVSVSVAALLSLLNAHADVQEAREAQARKDRERAARAAQMDIEGA